MSSSTDTKVSRWLPFIERIEEGYASLAPQGRRSQGIGGVRHQQIQLLIRDNAIQLGYGAEIEQQLMPGSRQKVDVGIRGDGVRVACEIPITSKYIEYPNIRKCLDAGYDFIVSVALDRKTLDVVRKGCLDKLSGEERRRVMFFLPEELLEFLSAIKPSLPPASSPGTAVRGYKVRVMQVPTSPEDTARRRNLVAQVLARAVLRESQSR